MLDTIAFRVLAGTAFLVPLIFVPVGYIPLESVKEYLIVLGVLSLLGVYACLFFKERTVILPPKIILYPALAVMLVMIVEAILVHPISKGLFGIGTEIYTAGFILVLFAAAYASYISVSRRPERSIILYIAAISSFAILFFFHAFRFIFGPQYATLGALSSLTSTVFGDWYAMAVYGLFIAIVSVVALTYLRISSKVRMFYVALALISGIAIAFIGDERIWAISALVFLGYALYATLSRPFKREGSQFRSWMRRIAWVPVVAGLVSAVFVWQGSRMMEPVIVAFHGGYSELRLSWQTTLDVGTSVIEADPLFGAGPNRFSESYLLYKPFAMNVGPAWSLRFDSGSGFFPTLFATEGLFGIVSWIVLLVFLGISGARALKKLPKDPSVRFMLISSYMAVVSGCAALFVSVEPHAIAFFVFVFGGIFFGTAASCEAADGSRISLRKPWHALVFLAASLLILLAGLVVYTKDALALAYFSEGASILDSTGDGTAALPYMEQASALNGADIYWRGQVQADIDKAQAIASSVGTSTEAASQAATALAALGDEARQDAERAVSYDPSSYEDRLSLARAEGIGIVLKSPHAYEDALASYAAAATYDPYDPSLYLEIARVQASNKDFTAAIKTLGSALSAKPDYSDAMSLMSQVYVAENDTKDAVAAAEAAAQSDPNNPALLYQLGALLYTTGDYKDAALVLARVTALQPGYANAEYFLGLSYAQLNRVADALQQFEDIQKNNPANPDISYIIKTLRSGGSLFSSPAAVKTGNAAKGALK